jgi:hypothetical protein
MSAARPLRAGTCAHARSCADMAALIMTMNWGSPVYPTLGLQVAYTV